MRTLLGLVTGSSLLLAGCAGVPAAGVAAAGGAAAGGTGGAALASSGTQAAAAVSGAALGGIVGHEIGKSIDETGRQRAAEAEQRALSTNQPVTWEAPPHAAGRVQPIRGYTNADGSECREFLDTVSIDGKEETATAKACREEGGRWQLVP
jgi:surface antigen